MSILTRIRAHGGDVIRDEYRMTLRPGKLSKNAIEWIASNRMALHREVWPLVDDWHERAAIREFDGGQCRDDAERDAYGEVMAR